MRQMNHDQIKRAIEDMAAMSAALTPEDAIDQIAALINRLEPSSDAYERDLASLLRVGATIQLLHADRLRM